MSKIIAFPESRRVERCEVTEEDIIDLKKVAERMPYCRACTGRGVFLFKGFRGLPAIAICPCGGSDEDRIDLTDFGGVA